MGSWMTRPECGAPLNNLVDLPGGRGVAIAESCARADGRWVAGLLLALAAALLVASFVWRRDDADATPVIPHWAAALPAAAGVAALFAAAPLARARLAAGQFDFATSGMTKPQWVAHRDAGGRSAAQLVGSLAGSAAVSTSVLGTAFIKGA